MFQHLCDPDGKITL